jgi:hypothetical protein
VSVVPGERSLVEKSKAKKILVRSEKQSIIALDTGRTMEVLYGQPQNSWTCFAFSRRGPREETVDQARARSAAMQEVGSTVYYLWNSELQAEISSNMTELAAYILFCYSRQGLVTNIRVQPNTIENSTLPRFKATFLSAYFRCCS